MLRSFGLHDTSLVARWSTELTFCSGLVGGFYPAKGPPKDHLGRPKNQDDKWKNLSNDIIPPKHFGLTVRSP